MKILITGDKGFIGTQISQFLYDKKTGYTGIDKGDRIPEDRFDIILHFGARTLIRNSLERPYEYFTDNEDFTMQILEKCRHDDSAIVFPTSGSVSLPTNPYSLSKKNGEDWVNMYSKLYGVRSHVLKLFNIYGEGSRKGAVYLFSKAASDNMPATVYGDGTHRRDFFHYLHCLKVNSRPSIKNYVVRFLFVTIAIVLPYPAGVFYLMRKYRKYRNRLDQRTRT